MSGLFGLIGAQYNDTVQFLKTAGLALSHRPWYQVDSWAAAEAPLGLGRTGIGILNSEPQPTTSVDGGLTVFVCGEFNNSLDLYRQLRNEGANPRNSSINELALCAYQLDASTFVERLDGAFFVAIYDQTRRRLTLANDRFGLYPHYYAYREQRVVFAPEVKGVLCAPFLPRRLNVTAAAEYLRFQQLLGEKTFHEDVYLFPYGSLAVYDFAANTWTIERYWDWDRIPERLEIKFDEAVYEVGRLLHDAVERRVADNLRPGVFLSGGLDSRTLLGFIPPRTPPPVTATFGQRDSRDVTYANQIAQAMGSEHHWFDMPDGHWVQENVDFHLRLTEGFHSWIHMHGIHMLPALRGLMEHNLTGWDGGTVMGHSDHINPVYNQPVDKTTVLVEMFKNFVSSYTWPGILEGEERLLFTPEFGRQAVGRAFDSMQAEFGRFWNFRQHYAAEYFYLVNHCWNSTSNMVKVARSHIEVRFPFWDYQLIDFIYSLRPEIRRDQLMYRHIITKAMPRLATIPYDKKELLPTVTPWLHSAHALSVRARRALRLFPYHPTLYADYENYLRYDLRSWAEGILYDKRVQARGIFDPAFVRSLMERHLAGREAWTLGKVAPLITFEMVLREYFD